MSLAVVLDDSLAVVFVDSVVPDDSSSNLTQVLFSILLIASRKTPLTHDDELVLRTDSWKTYLIVEGQVLQRGFVDD